MPISLNPKVCYEVITMMSATEAGSWTAFMIKVAQRLQKTAGKLSEEGKKGNERRNEQNENRFYTLLAAELFSLADSFENRPTGEHRLLEILGNLEKLCQLPTTIVPPCGRAERSNSREYPTLAEILVNDKLAEDVIRNMATSSRLARMELIRNLKDCGDIKQSALGPELSELLGSRTILDEEDNRAYIQALYSTLASHCRCPDQAIRTDITTNLLLNSRGTSEDRRDSASFRLFFLDHPHDHSNDDSCRWQDAQVCVIRKREVKFETEQLSSCNTPVDKVLMGKFCELISKRKWTQLKLDISENGLILKGNGALPRDFLFEKSSLSLGDLLNIPNIKISRRMRLLLSYYLVKAVWQFYGSDWMRREWTKDTVHFMAERSRNTLKSISINKPFLSTRFDELELTKEEDESYRTHEFPSILALGIMLIEIELGTRIEEYRPKEWLPTDVQSTRNIDHTAAMAVFENTELWKNRDTFSAVQEIIGACLSPDDFAPYKNDTDGVRDILERRMVLPIQRLYQWAWEDPEESNLGAIEINGSGGMPNLHVFPQKRHIDDEHIERKRICTHQTKLPLAKGIMSGSTSDASSEDWFKRLETFTSALRFKPQVRGDIYRPTKIAILDTGVSDNYAERIEDYKDFVGQKDDSCRDDVGHGTSAALLIWKVYNKAELYIGRVFEDTEARSNTPILMAEAIDYARKIWKVDIIVIASGFIQPNDDMRHAIDEAGRDSILIFAAASNSGNLGGVAFPGKLYMYNKLLCMFSTDANARCSSFNPSACPGARYSFAVFGEKVFVPPINELLSGTSYATMIGAAIAGRILDFSRHSDVWDKIRNIDCLNRVEGMSAVFAIMANGAVDNMYHCITPWKILPPEVADENPEAKRVRERNYVRETISRALEGV